MSGSIIPMATLPEMQAWAESAMTRAPDFVIGDDYLRRWWMVPRNEGCNIYLHEIRRSDDDRALHDHPWANTSFLLRGGYIEHTPAGPFIRRAGDVVTREAETLHRLEVIPGQSAVSLFITGPKVREWGFACPQGWVHWRDFTDPDNPGQSGRGCGEHGDPTPPSSPFVLPRQVGELDPGRADECADVIAHLARRMVGARELASRRPGLAELMRDRERQAEIEIEEIASGQHRAQATIEGVRARYNSGTPAS